MRLHTMARAGVLWTSLASLAIGEDVAQIPSPRPEGWVTDLTGKLGAGTIADLNALGDEIVGRQGGEIAVVLIRSTDGRVPRRFATDLFNRWGIGRRDADDGVLVFVALLDRKAEIVLGDGVDDERRVRLSRDIMDNTLLPHLRRGDFDGGILQAAHRCADEILGAPVAGAAMPALPLVDPGPAPEPWQTAPCVGEGFLWGGLSLLGTVGAGFGIRHYVRHRPPACPGCGFPMTRLGKQAGEAHLTAAERVEQTVGSVNHYVWSCESCDQVCKRSYNVMFTSYSRCQACQARTQFTTRRTIRHPTRYSTGLREVTVRCQHCPNAISREEAIPCLPPPSSSSSSSRSSGGSSSRSSGGSSSGFSGGSSSGGGASGGW